LLFLTCYSIDDSFNIPGLYLAQKKILRINNENCKHYLEALDKIRVCPFLKRQIAFPSSYIYICEASKYVHVSFSKINEVQLSKHYRKKNRKISKIKQINFEMFD